MLSGQVRTSRKSAVNTANERPCRAHLLRHLFTRLAGVLLGPGEAPDMQLIASVRLKTDSGTHLFVDAVASLLLGEGSGCVPRSCHWKHLQWYLTGGLHSNSIADKHCAQLKLSYQSQI